MKLVRWTWLLVLAGTVAPAFPACVPFSFPGTTMAVDGGGCNVDLTWTAASGEGAITYSVYRNAGMGFVQVASGLTGTTHREPVVRGDFTYQYYIAGTDSCTPVAQSGNNFTSSPLKPFCPSCGFMTFLGATSALPDTSCGGIDLSWQAATGYAPISYSVFRNAGMGFVQIATGLSATTHRDLGVPGTDYEYYVLATDSCPVLPQSMTNFTSPPVTPLCVSGEVQNVDLRCESGVLVMTWDPVPGATGYNIYRGTLDSLNAGPPVYNHTDFGVCNIAGTSFTFPGDCLAADAYFFIVVARNGAAELAYGNVDGLPIPAALTVCP